MAKGPQTGLSGISVRLLLVGLLAATAVAVQHCAADETAGYRSLKFSVAAGGDALLLPVRFAGGDYLFALDTGSTRTVVDECFREKLGEPLRTGPARTPLGEVRVSTYRAPPATIADRPLSGVIAVDCADLSLMRAASGHDIYGLLGMDFLCQRRVRIDFDAGELTFLESVPDESGEPIALSYSVGHGGVTARVDLEGAGEQAFAIDTGLVMVGHVEARLLHRLVQVGHATAVGDGKIVSLGGEVATRARARLGDLALERFGHRGLVVSAGTRSALGTVYLSRYLVTFDFPAMTMYLKPGARFKEPSLCDLSGLRLWRPGGLTIVHSVADGSAAQRAGLMADDVIEKIGARAATSISLLEIYRLFAMPGRHTIRVVRGDKTLEAVLVLEEMPAGLSRRPGN